MKKLILPILLFMMFIPFYVNAEEYYLGNIKVGQRFENGDTIYHVIQQGEFLEDSDTLNNLIANERYPHLLGTDIFGRMYGINFVIDDTVNPCSGSCQSFSFSHYPDGKEYYWTLENYEELSTLEAAAVYFKTHEKIPSISIISLVNDTDKYNAKKDEMLKYSVKVKNLGDGKSTNNTIITNVPKGIFVIEDKIADGGVYDKANSQIEWNYDLFEPDSEYTFNYYAKVIDDSINEYVGNSYIISEQILEKVNSENTIVILQNTSGKEITNPKTGVNNYIIIVGLLMTISVGICIALKRKKFIF